MEGNDSTKKDKLISVDAALSIKADCNLGREKYYHLRKNLKNQGYDILPPWTNLVTKERKITPETTCFSGFGFLGQLILDAGKMQ